LRLRLLNCPGLSDHARSKQVTHLAAAFDVHCHLLQTASGLRSPAPGRHQARHQAARGYLVASCAGAAGEDATKLPVASDG